MTISVTGPDGSSFSFPDGTSETDISSAMDSHYGAAKAEPKDVSPLVDLAKATPVGVAQGIIGLPGMGGDLQQLAKAGVEKAAEKTGLSAANPLGWVTSKFEEHFPNAAKFIKESNAKSANAPIRQISSGDMPGEVRLPTSSDIQGQVEKVTGPFYQAKTALGRVGQTAGQVGPVLATGGGSVAGLAGKAVGAGLGAEGAGQAADALKGYLPDAAAPYAEPVARALGTGAGVFAPSAVRRAITPLPMTNAQMANVNALKATNPELVNASSAGQLTQSPRIMGLETRSPRMADIPEKQAEAYTQGVMRQAGSPGMFDTAGLAQAKGTGAQLDTLRNAHQMSPAEFAALNRDVNAMGRPGSELFRAVGSSKSFKEAQDAISLGPSGGNPPPLNMTGQRYGALKQILQAKADAAPTSHERIAINNAQERVKEAFHNSMPAAEAEKLRQLDQQYSNYKTIEGIPTKPDQNTISPSQVFNKASRGSELEQHATQAASVMKPLPKPNTEGGFLTKTLGGVLPLAGDALFHGGTTLGAEAPFISYYGYNHLNDAVNALKNVAGRAVALPPIQSYLKKQKFRPTPNSSADKSTLLRLLMSPPVEQLPGQ